MIPAIVLAAGASRRLGRPKQLVRVGGRTLVGRTVEAAEAAGCTVVVVVTGAAAEDTAGALRETRAVVVHNADWARGQASSIRRGVLALEVHAPDAAGVLLLACDQPRLDAGILEALVRGWRSSGMPMAACEYARTLGVPAVFERALFPALRALGGDRGARDLLRAPGAAVFRIPWPDGEIDVDEANDVKER